MFELEWKKYSDFFSLYKERNEDEILLYVIGKTREVYVGVVGIRGKNGLKQRYQKSYVERAISIFGSSSPINQPSYAATVIKPKAPGNLLLDLEEIIQNHCENHKNMESVKFTKRKKHVPHKVLSTGQRPPWLPETIDAKI